MQFHGNWNTAVLIQSLDFIWYMRITSWKFKDQFWTKEKEKEKNKLMPAYKPANLPHQAFLSLISNNMKSERKFSEWLVTFDHLNLIFIDSIQSLDTILPMFFQSEDDFLSTTVQSLEHMKDLPGCGPHQRVRYAQPKTLLCLWLMSVSYVYLHCNLLYIPMLFRIGFPRVL